jgi:hypothetical protein
MQKEVSIVAKMLLFKKWSDSFITTTVWLITVSIYDYNYLPLKKYSSKVKV